MVERKKKMPGTSAGLAAVLLMGLAVGLLVLLGAGLLMSALVVRGAVGLESLGRAALIALFLAALAGGWFTARRLRSMALVWGLCTALEIAVICLLIGAMFWGIPTPGAAFSRLAAALLGGAAAGVLSAARKK